MNIHYCAPVVYCKLFFLTFDVIFSIAKGIQHDGRLPFWKPASVFAYDAFAFWRNKYLLLCGPRLGGL